jgi:hypothetical protein
MGGREEDAKAAVKAHFPFPAMVAGKAPKDQDDGATQENRVRCMC